MSEAPRTSTTAWKWRRREAIIRDGYACQECGAKGGPEGDAELHAHHLTPAAEGGDDDLENLETLCKSCHLQEHRCGEEESADCSNALRNPERDEDSGRFTETFPAEDFLQAIDTLGGEAGTSEVADEVGCAYRTAKAKLDALEEDGDVVSRRVGSALLWRIQEDDADA